MITKRNRSDLTSTTNVQGHFRFEGVAPGNYALHAKFTGFQGCTEGPFLLHDHETKSFRSDIHHERSRSFSIRGRSSGKLRAPRQVHGFSRVHGRPVPPS